MLYCDVCADGKSYPRTRVKAQGNCGYCGEVSLCNDLPTSTLSAIRTTNYKYDTDCERRADGRLCPPKIKVAEIER